MLLVGDVMQDAALFFAGRTAAPKDFEPGQGSILAAMHRAEHTEDPRSLG